MAIDCLRIIRERPDVEIPLVITEPRDSSLGDSLASYCEKENVSFVETPAVNSSNIIERLSNIGPDLIFNINSYKIIKERMLSIPKEGIINFHNGPLPRYGGVNVCSWAIINGEKEHGVTWHYIDRGVDTGDIIAQRFFKLDPDETAVRLIIKCIREGIALFKEIFPKLLEGGIGSKKQDLSKSTYFSLKDIPNGGFVNYGWPYEKLESFVRGLSFHPMANNFAHPKSTHNSREFFIQTVARLDGSSSARDYGKVIDIGQEQIGVQIMDSIIAVRAVLDEHKNHIRIKDFIESYGIRIGQYFEPR